MAPVGSSAAGAAHYRSNVNLKPVRYLWERVYPRRSLRGVGHRLRRYSRLKPLPQVQRQLQASAAPVGAGAPAKQTTRLMAPASPVFAAKAAPTGTASTPSQRSTCGSGRARETDDAVDGTGFAGVRGRDRSHKALGLTGAEYPKANAASTTQFLTALRPTLDQCCRQSSPRSPGWCTSAA